MAPVRALPGARSAAGRSAKKPGSRPRAAGAAGAEFHLRREPGAHHAHFVQDEPPPERDAARRVRPAGRVQAALVPVEPEGLVQRLAADVRRVRGLEGGHLEVDALHVAEQLLEEFPPHEVEHVRLARAGTPVQQPEQRLLAVSGRLVRLHEPVFDQHSLHDQLQELALLRVEAALHVVADQPLAQKPFADPSEGVGGGSSARVVQSLHCDRRFLLVSVAGFARVLQHALRADDAVWPVEDDPLSMLSGVSAREVRLLAGASEPEALREIDHLHGEVVLRGGVRRRGRRCLVCLFLLRFVRRRSLLLCGPGSSHSSLHRFVQLVLLEVEDHVLHAFVVAVRRQVGVGLQRAGQAVHEGVAQDVALQLLGGEAARARPGKAESLPPAGHLRRSELADVGHRLRGVLRVAGPGAEEQEHLLGVLVLAAAAQGAVGHGSVGPLARADDPVVSIGLCEASLPERHPVLAALLLDHVVHAGLQVSLAHFVGALLLAAVGEQRVEHPLFCSGLRAGCGGGLDRSLGRLILVLCGPREVGLPTVVVARELVGRQRVHSRIPAAIAVERPVLRALDHALLLCMSLLSACIFALSAGSGVCSVAACSSCSPKDRESSAVGAVLMASAAVGSLLFAWSRRLAHSHAPRQTPRQKHCVMIRLDVRAPT